MITIKKVWIEWLVDENPDVSWLVPDAKYHYGTDGCNWNHVPKADIAAVIEKHGSLMAACEHYAKEDQERLIAFYRGEWYMMGCVAKAVVSVPWGKYRRIQTFQSAGLWGIESDGDMHYHADVATEELSDLKEHLEQFGIDTSDFEERRV